jgi:hypothetical protein
MPAAADTPGAASSQIERLAGGAGSYRIRTPGAAAPVLSEFGGEWGYETLRVATVGQGCYHHDTRHQD